MTNQIKRNSAVGECELYGAHLLQVLKMKFDQDLCKNLRYELNPLVRCAFGNDYSYVT